MDRKSENSTHKKYDKLLSIIIPVYNLEWCIDRCLNSLLEQDIDKSLYEIICINDGSSDATHTILENYKEANTNIIVVHTENQGVVLARSTGLEIATGKYVWFVDGDDWIKRNCLKYLVDIVENGDNDLLLFKEEKVSEYKLEDVNFHEFPPHYYDNPYHSFSSHYTTGSGFYWFKKQILDDYNIKYRPDIYYSDDTLFICKFKLRSNSMVITDAPIYYYYQREDSVSHAVRYSCHCGCMYKLAKEYEQLADEFSYDESKSKRLNKAKTRAMQACFRNIVLFCKDKEFLKSFLKRTKLEGLYPYGIDWEQFRVDKKQSRKSDLLNWISGLLSFEPYLWLVWLICSSMRKKEGVETFDINDFNDEF